MNGHKHIIRTIRFDAEIGNEELLEHWQNTLRRVSIESVFTKVFQPYDLQKEWTCIDRLEIDLGDMSWENEEEWNYKIMAALEAQLSQKLTMNNPAFGSFNLMKTAYAEELSNVVTIDDDTYRMQALIDYLETGSCPWQLEKYEDAGEELMELILKNPMPVAQKLRRVLQSSASAVERLMMVLNYQQLMSVIKLFAGEKTVEDLISLYAAIEKSVPLAKGKMIKQKMIRRLLECSAICGEDVQQLIERLFQDRFIALFDVRHWKKIKSIIGEQIGHNEKLVRMLNQTIQGIVDTHEKREVNEDSETIGVIAREIDIENKTSAPKSEYEEQAEEIETLEEVVFINDSGLVLLNAALIKYFFKKLGWIQENDFRNEIVRKKAILWLHYLTHGSGKIREYELSLPKLLCGMLPSDIADIKLRLTKKERNAGDEMIETVIDSWTVLKKVSIEGVRQSFLQREGRLTHDEAGWQLHVKSMAYDMLIEQLPWSYSIIKFPWMIKPLFTQWSTRI